MGLNQAGILSAYQSGRRLFRSFSKAPAQTTALGIWFDLSMSPGNPVAQYYFATPQTAIALARSTDGGLDHGESKPGYNKYLHRVDLQTVNAITPLAVEVLDYLMYYPGIPMDPGSYAMVNNISLPRYTYGQIMLIEQNPYVGGATFTIDYINQDGNSATTPVQKCNTQVVAGTIATSATATVQCQGRYVTLAANDYGVRRITGLTIINGDVGLLCAVIVRPLTSLYIYEATQPSQYDLWNDQSELPIIKDDAYLNLICMPSASLAGASIIGNITTFWSAA